MVTRLEMPQRSQRRAIPVTYVYYPDEGHGLGRADNRSSFTAVVEAFLAAHLGGRCEPVGDDFAGSTIEFKASRELTRLSLYTRCCRSQLAIGRTPQSGRVQKSRHERADVCH
jgi:hypothetical protein